MNPGKLKIAFVSPYPYKFSAISTFTRNLIFNLKSKLPQLEPKIFPLIPTILKEKNLSTSPYSIVRKIEVDDAKSLVETVKRINQSGIDLVNFQLVGSFITDLAPKNYLGSFIKMLNKPTVITFHEGTADKNNFFFRLHFQEIAKRNNIFFSVISKAASQFLIQEFHVPKERVKIIPNGSPFLPLKEKEEIAIRKKLRKQYHLEGKIILFTHGFINPRKGQIYAIKALPKIIAEFPNVVYMACGSTEDILNCYPKSRQLKYRKYLSRCKSLARKLNIGKNVIFINKFLSLQEMRELLIASDIYLAPSTDEWQLSSAILPEALGSGKAVIATKTLISKELIINNQNGILISRRSPSAISLAVVGLIKNPSLKKNLEENAAQKALAWHWPNLTSSYMDLFLKAIRNYKKRGKITITIFVSRPISPRILFKEFLTKRKVFHFLNILNSKVILYAPFYLPSLGFKKALFSKKQWNRIQEKFLLFQYQLIRKLGPLIVKINRL